MRVAAGALAALILLPAVAHGLQEPDSVPTAEDLIRRGHAFVGTVERLAEVRTLDALASCRGPTGPFETRVLSHRDGSMVFRQTYEDRGPDVLAGIREGRAWQAVDSREIAQGSEATAAFLRGHEFLFHLVAPESRLATPRVGQVEVFAGRVARSLEFEDVAGNPFQIHYALDDGRPLGFTQTNPTSEGPLEVRVELADWSEVEGLRLPGHLTIYHGQEVWHYEFVQVGVNTLGADDFDPEGLVSSGPGGTALREAGDDDSQAT